MNSSSTVLRAASYNLFVLRPQMQHTSYHLDADALIFAACYCSLPLFIALL